MFGPRMEGEPGSCGFVHKRIIGAVGGFFGGGPVGAVSGFLGGGGSRERAQVGGDAGLGFANTSGGCSDGFEPDADGQCVRTGIRGAGQRFFPGGETGTQADVMGEAVVGSFGLSGVIPRQVGSITRNDGVVSPILRCPARYVLAIDNICYVKGQKGLAAFRKWRPGTKPFLTGGDVKCLRRANTLRASKASKKLLKELGMG